jgi:hypothetical protein
LGPCEQVTPAIRWKCPFKGPEAPGGHPTFFFPISVGSPLAVWGWGFQFKSMPLKGEPEGYLALALHGGAVTSNPSPDPHWLSTGSP